ncbi:MAG TPA: Gfo/Idh/MocA family oxidoreductase [Candidatus Hydrogenedentes bacterium]|nr:Gfo/Idh/MocA family oxidoreductase [Candidatus Hydrogenedentota bacterium]
MTARVAVIGASGIGRHHANWWRLEGAEVCAFVGTSSESVAQTKAVLEQMIGFRGAGYTDIELMLRREQPDIVDVCSPAPFHAAHVRLALEAGCHVLCEKPFVFDPALPHHQLLAQARELIALAEACGRQLGVCTQYSVGAQWFKSIYGEMHENEKVSFYRGHLEAPAKGRIGDPVRIWTDLSPHLLSVILACFPDAEPCWDTLQTRFEGYEAEAFLIIQTGLGTNLRCELYTRNRNEDPPNIRQFIFNECMFQVDAARDAEGAFCARIITPDRIVDQPDMMRLLIRDSLRGSPTVTGRAIIKNMEWMLNILECATH